MYRIYADGNLIYSPYVDELKLTSAKLELEQNAQGTFTFTIYPTNPYINEIEKMKTLIYVYQDGLLIFKGIAVNDTIGFRNQRTIQCKEEYYFLEYSIQRPYEFAGSPSDLFSQLIEEHNSQVDEEHQFIVGTCTVTDEDENDYITRSDTTYLNTWESIQEKLIDTLGGYLQIRHEDDGNYIDYLEDFDTMNSQEINFGENLVDLETENDALEIGTVLIPLGAKLSDIEDEDEDEDDEAEETDDDEDEEDTSELEENARLTIESVNDGLDYIENEDAIEKYGRIVRVETWDDVTVASNLLTKAKARLAELEYHTSALTINAIDMGLIDADISHFQMHNYVKVTSDIHEIDDYYLPLKMSIDLFNPANNRLELNSTSETLTDKTIQQSYEYNNVLKTVESVTYDVSNLSDSLDANVQSLILQLSSTVENTSSYILSLVEENYVTTEQLLAIESNVSEIYQTANEIVLSFESIQTDLTNLGTYVYDYLQTAFTFSDDGLLITQSDSDISILIENDQVSFLQGNNVVAYVSNNKLYIENGEFLSTLRLGNFVFMPRSDNSLDFKLMETTDELDTVDDTEDDE